MFASASSLGLHFQDVTEFLQGFLFLGQLCSRTLALALGKGQMSWNLGLLPADLACQFALTSSAKLISLLSKLVKPKPDFVSLSIAPFVWLSAE